MPARKGGEVTESQHRLTCFATAREEIQTLVVVSLMVSQVQMVSIAKKNWHGKERRTHIEEESGLGSSSIELIVEGKLILEGNESGASRSAPSSAWRRAQTWRCM